MKIVTVCLRERAGSTAARLSDISSLLREMADLRVRPMLAILPGGTFDLKTIRLNSPEKATRIGALDRAGIIRPLQELCGRFNSHLIFGVDTKNSADQCVCHVDRGGVRCVTRKVFPVKGDEADRWVSNVEDAMPENRVTRINGRRFLLAACYDMFGAEVLKHKDSKILSGIKYFSKGGLRIARGDSGFAEIKEEFVSRWCKSVETSDIGIACIHDFTKKGQFSGLSSWQQVGIRKQVPFFKMELIFAAAHYTDGRSFPKDSSRALLADGVSILRKRGGSHLLLNGRAMVREWDIEA